MENFETKSPVERGPESKWGGWKGLMDSMEDDKETEENRAGRWVRSLFTQGNPEEIKILGMMDLELNRSGESFTFFRKRRTPNEVVEPLFEAITAATDDEGRRGAIKNMIKTLQNSEER
jgi:hypothetical protein